MSRRRRHEVSRRNKSRRERVLNLDESGTALQRAAMVEHCPGSLNRGRCHGQTGRRRGLYTRSKLRRGVANLTSQRTLELSIPSGFSSISQVTELSEPAELLALKGAKGGTPEDISARLDSMTSGLESLALVHSELAKREQQLGATWSLPMVVPLVRIGDKVVTFPNPLEATLRKGGLGYVLSVPVLDILATGLDIPDVQDNLNEEVEVLVSAYLRAPDSRLSPESIELKRKLSALLPGL